MKCWYFSFEGEFKSGDPTYGCKGVFSSCIVPRSNYGKAESAFRRALSEDEIDLLNITECFDIDVDLLNPEDPVNPYWIDWCKKAIEERKPIFDKWHVFHKK